MVNKNEITVAIVGCGTVGGATALLLTKDAGFLQQKTGLIIKLKYIVDIDFTHARELRIDARLYEKNLDTVLEDKEVEILIELIGGIDTARQIIRAALKSGKHVVTANKALLAHHGAELFGLARRNGVTLSFEASCAGGIPIVRALYDGLTANRIDALYGIVNGTCNYILTEMIQKGQNYAEALSEAQKSGLAELDPTLDVSGMDSAHKLAILAALAFGKKVELEAIPVQGIDTLELIDVKFGLELGYIVKLLAVAQRLEDGISLRVRPAFITREHPLAWVSGPFNAVSVYGHAVGHTMYYGRGAGGSPTSSAVVSDIISVALGLNTSVFNHLKIWPDITEPARQVHSKHIKSRYYIRLMVVDKPGVFGQIAGILGQEEISISSVLQKETSEEGAEPVIVPVVITTHTTLEGKVEAALKKLKRLEPVVQKGVCINIVDEHEEILQ
ncbi:MAG: homoserine dehydrogenase [Spirochaetota bacterium]